MNRYLAAVLWVLGALALVWVLLVVAAMTGMGGMMRGGSMMGGSMMNGRPMMGGMMLAMAVTWVIILGLIGILVYLLIVAVRSRRRKPANDVGLDREGSEPRER